MNHILCQILQVYKYVENWFLVPFIAVFVLNNTSVLIEYLIQAFYLKISLDCFFFKKKLKLMANISNN